MRGTYAIRILTYGSRPSRLLACRRTALSPRIKGVSPLDTTASYHDTVVRQFTIMTVLWGIVGMLVGVVIAAQLRWPALNFDLPFLT